MGRRRVAAVIVRDQHVLMVRERGRGPAGRHDGAEYWTLPGGGIEPGETDEAAIAREVREEVRLQVISTRPLQEIAYPSGPTTYFWVEVDAGEPELGTEDGSCDCPRLVGLQWVPLPELPSATGGLPVPLLLYSFDAPPRQPRA